MFIFYILIILVLPQKEVRLNILKDLKAIAESIEESQMLKHLVVKFYAVNYKICKMIFNNKPSFQNFS